MKKLIAAATAAFMFTTVNLANAQELHVPDGVKGLVTGALIGSIFGPNKKSRAKNALIGAVSGYLIADQYAKSRLNDNGWTGSRSLNHGTVRTSVPQQTVIIPQTGQIGADDYWQETRTIYTNPTTGSQTIIIERRNPVVVKQYDHNFGKRGRGHHRSHRRSHRTSKQYVDGDIF